MGDLFQKRIVTEEDLPGVKGAKLSSNEIYHENRIHQSTHEITYIGCS